MSKNLVRKTLTMTGTFSVPAGVTAIEVFADPLPRKIVSASNMGTYAIDSAGVPWAWGEGALGRLGNNTTSNVSSPSQIAGNHRFIDISNCGDTGIGRKADGSVFTWGQGTSGELGDNSTTSKSSPVAVAGGHMFVEIGRGGDDFVMARKVDGTVWTWGLGTSGQLGDNTVTSKSSPVQVAGGHLFVEIAGMDSAAVARKADGSVWTWGNGANGRLGNNTTTSTSSPVAVVGGHVFVEISAGHGSDGGGNGNHVLARKADGTVWAWGLNTNGQLGDNSTTDKSSPVQVAGGHLFVEISAGSTFSMGRKVDGSVWCWGLGTSGQLGDNTTTSKSSPVQVSGSHIFVEISGGSIHAMARKADGSAWGWGMNNTAGSGGQGRLGDNTTTTKSSPVQVSGQYFAPMNFETNSEAQRRIPLTVTPGASISYATGVLAYFGNTQLDSNVDKIIVEYFA